VRLQQTFVEGDRFFQLQALDARVDARRARGLVDFDLQIAEAAHRLGAHLLVLRLQLQEVTVLLDRLLRLHVGRRIGRNLDLFGLQVLDRGDGLLRGLLGGGGLDAERADARDRDDQEVTGQRVVGAHCDAPLLPLPLAARS
jgi:hypothetical protein